MRPQDVTAVDVQHLLVGELLLFVEVDEVPGGL